MSDKTELEILKKKVINLIDVINKNKTRLWVHDVSECVDCIILEEEKIYETDEHMDFEEFEGIEVQLQDLENFLGINQE